MNDAETAGQAYIRALYADEYPWVEFDDDGEPTHKIDFGDGDLRKAFEAGYQAAANATERALT